MGIFLSTLFTNIVRSFTHKRAYLHLIGIILTAVIVNIGYDWVYFIYVQENSILDLFSSAVIVGALVPIVIPITLIVTRKYRLYGWALAQAALAGSIISSTYKAFTGRIQPDISNLLTDHSRGFNFGFWENGIFWGWPSSHTTIAFAMAICLIFITKKNKFIMPLALAYAFYIAIGISLRIHWLSEAVAGVFVGTAIGIAVGDAFAKIISVKKN